MTTIRCYKKPNNGIAFFTPGKIFQGGYEVQVQSLLFSAEVVSGNVIRVTIDGYDISQSFTTDHDTTLAALVSQISARPNVRDCQFDGNLTITVTAYSSGLNIVFTNMLVDTALAASGTITYGSPVDGDTITVDGTTFTKVASGPGLGATEFSSASELTTLIDAISNVDAEVSDGIITITAATAGTAGNAITLAKTGSALTLSGATLSGGYSPATIVVSTETPYELSFSDITFPSWTSGLDYIDLDSVDLPEVDSREGLPIERLWFDGTPSLVNLVDDTGWDDQLKPYSLVKTEYLERLHSEYETELAGVAASATVTYGSPADGDTITVDGTTFTKVAAGPDVDEFTNIGQLNVLIHALTNVNCTHDGTTITITAAATGTTGNSIALSKTGSALTLSGATLSGGIDPNAINLARIQSKLNAISEIERIGSTTNSYASTAINTPLDEPLDEWALFWCNADLENLNAGVDRATYRTKLLAKILEIETAISERE